MLMGRSYSGRCAHQPAASGARLPAGAGAAGGSDGGGGGVRRWEGRRDFWRGHWTEHLGLQRVPTGDPVGKYSRSVPRAEIEPYGPEQGIPVGPFCPAPRKGIFGV